MRLKYYLRGIGCGMLLATVMLSIFFYFGGGFKQKEKLTDAEIILRATDLGMVMGEAGEIDTDEDGQALDEVSSEDVIASETTETIDAVEDENKDKTIEEYVAEGDASRGEQESSVSYVAFTVSGGQSSETICSNLYQKGLIDDPKEFNKYLNTLGIDKRIPNGTFYIKEGSSYDDIAAELVNKDSRTTTPPDLEETN